MYPAIAQVTVDPNHEDESRTMIHDVVLPKAQHLPGFVSGNWLQTLDDERGIAVLFFESEKAAGAAAEGIRSGGPLAGTRVHLEAVDPYEVLVHA